MTRPTEALVDLSAIQKNIGLYRKTVGEDVAVMAVVKADGYGHGAVPVAHAALQAGAQWLGVALAEEGEVLRKAGLTHVPILILGQSMGGQIDLALRYGLELTVFDPETLRQVEDKADKRGVKASVHVKIDTGMGRVGMSLEEWQSGWLERLQSPYLRWRGLMSHFAESDSEDPEFTRVQLGRFLDAVEFARTRVPLPILHVANSASALRYPGTYLNMVRVGIAMYGGKPFPAAEGLQPAMTLKSRIGYLKTVPKGFYVGYGRTYRTAGPALIATVPIGYADGYRRGLSNQAEVLIRGRRYPVVGRISMDQLTVALPPDAPVRIGEAVTLLGADGDDRITAEELADKLGTISYEIFTGISPRVPRRYSVDT